MKEKYQKPLIMSDAGIEGVVPAAAAAFLAGMAFATEAKKMLKGHVGWEKVNKLVEVGVSV